MALFGIKADKSWTRKVYSSTTKECYDGVNLVTETGVFRAYDSWEDSIADHSAFLTGFSRYRAVIGETDYKEACQAIWAAGYATDPNYPSKLINIIEMYGLSEYDKEGEATLSKKIMIDPGHAPGNANKGANGYFEHDGMWKVSNYLKAALERCGCIVGLTRGENEDPSLTARGKKAAGHDLFISEHSNAGGGKGVEVYYSIKLPTDRNFAAALSKAVAGVMGTADRGAKTKIGVGGDYYTVIASAQAAGTGHVLLIENGFHDNLQDEAFLLKNENLKAIAEAQAKVICNFLGVTYKESEEEMVKRYQTIEELRADMSWAVPTIEKLQKKEYLKSLDLTADMIRMFVVNDMAGLYD